MENMYRHIVQYTFGAKIHIDYIPKRDKLQALYFIVSHHPCPDGSHHCDEGFAPPPL